MRVAIYCRVSSEEQAMHGLSLADQEKACRDWCAANGHSIVDIYIDAGISARKVAKKRPALQRLLEAVKRDEIDMIVFTKLDRWFRNTQQYFIVDEVLSAHHVCWYAILENHETQTAQGQFEVTIMLGLAQMEADNTSQRLKFTFEQMRLRGESTNGHVPFGLEVVDKHIQPSEQAHIVKEMFEHYVGCRSSYQTSVWLSNTYGIERGYQAVRGLLKNRRYVEYGVVPEPLFDTVQAISGQHDTRTGNPNNIYLFTSLVRCGGCGSHMGATTHCYVRKDGTRERYYRCPRCVKNKSCSNNQILSESSIERYLLDNLLTAVDSHNEVAIAEKQQAEQVIDINSILKKKERLADLYLNDRISKDKYEAEYQKLMASVPRVKKKYIQREEIIDATAIYDRLSREAKREFWGRTISAITIYQDRSIEFLLL